MISRPEDTAEDLAERPDSVRAENFYTDQLRLRANPCKGESLAAHLLRDVRSMTVVIRDYAAGRKESLRQRVIGQPDRRCIRRLGERPHERGRARQVNETGHVEVVVVDSRIKNCDRHTGIAQLASRPGLVSADQPHVPLPAGKDCRRWMGLTIERRVADARGICFSGGDRGVKRDQCVGLNVRYAGESAELRSR